MLVKRVISSSRQLFGIATLFSPLVTVTFYSLPIGIMVRDKKWKPIDARKFSCDVSVRPNNCPYTKIFLAFQSFSCRVLPPAARKWNTAATKRDSSVIRSCLVYWVWREESLATVFQRKWKLNMQDFTLVVRKRLTSLNRFQELHARWAWVIIFTVFDLF